MRPFDSLRTRTTNVVGHPNRDRIVHLNTPLERAADTKTTFSDPAQANSALLDIVGPHANLAELGTVEEADGGNVTNVTAALDKLQSPSRRLIARVTGRKPVVAHIALGNDEHARQIGSNPAFQDAVITYYDGPSILNTVINGGKTKDTLSLAPLDIPGGFKPETKKPHRDDTFLTSVKGAKWESTYRDAIQHKLTYPKSRLAVSPGSWQMQNLDKNNPDDAVYGAIKVADVLFVNKSEALGLIGKTVDESLSITEIFAEVKALGPKIISITDEDKGSYAMGYDGIIHYLDIAKPSKPEQKKKTVLKRRGTPELQGPIVDPIGAGDGYAAGFWQAYLEGRGIREAMRWGALNAAFIVRQEDANSGQLHRKDLIHHARSTRRTYQPVNHAFINEITADSQQLLQDALNS